jgi:UDP-N-acetylglucosamine diphosphorylase / glucose-1-phosphate thymidylyltransferase / UDP-N-acetylgalactosamine diphosphorylase / glucosamine-1-phosphate N-acetyltransferase / galactosamine-1-phosphate N-acetyltransferase
MINPDDITIFIMAGGKGSRLRRYSKVTPKVLLKVADYSIIERNIEIVRDKLKKKEVHIVLGYYADEIKSYLEAKPNLGITIIYHQIEVDQVEKGLVYSLIKFRQHIKKYFMILLGDEIYFSSDHDKMMEEMLKRDEFDIYCMIRKSNFPDEVLKNYAVETSEDKITFIEEKPEKAENRFAGLGSIACSSKVLDLIEPEINQPNPKHFIDLLNEGVNKNFKAYYFLTQCDYFNINNKNDFFLAKYSYRANRANDWKKSAVIPAYNEAETIGHVVIDIKPYVDEVIVMDNQSPDGTAEIAKKAGAKVFSRPLKGYGDAIRQGMEEASGDILIITEADMTFRAKDLPKLLEYLMDADAVIGTRTNRNFIHDQANMNWLLRLGNILMGKIISILWWDHQCRLSDVGCTYRALWRSSYDEVKENLKGDGPEFSPEMMVEFLNSYLRLVEIPVHYHERALGESKISISKWHSILVAFKMLKCILSKRWGKWVKNFIFTIKN